MFKITIEDLGNNKKEVFVVGSDFVLVGEDPNSRDRLVTKMNCKPLFVLSAIDNLQDLGLKQLSESPVSNISRENLDKIKKILIENKVTPFTPFEKMDEKTRKEINDIVSKYFDKEKVLDSILGDKEKVLKITKVLQEEGYDLSDLPKEGNIPDKLKDRIMSVLNDNPVKKWKI